VLTVTILACWGLASRRSCYNLLLLLRLLVLQVVILGHVAIDCLRLGLLAQFLSDLFLRLNVTYYGTQDVVVTLDVGMLMLQVCDLDALAGSTLTTGGVGTQIGCA